MKKIFRFIQQLLSKKTEQEQPIDVIENEKKEPAKAEPVAEKPRCPGCTEPCPYSHNPDGCCGFAHTTSDGRHLCFWMPQSKIDVTGRDICCPYHSDRKGAFTRRKKFIQAERKWLKHEAKMQTALTEGEKGTEFA